ncbi:MAG: hypothetical protein ABH833_00675 [Parcubacteria group bacterium]
MERLKNSSWLTFLIILVLSFIVFGNSIAGDFVFDDTVIIRDRGDVRSPDSYLNFFVSPYHQNTPESGLYRPLTVVSYALNFAVFGESPVSFHVINILLHALSGLLVFYLVRYLFSSDRLAWISALILIVLPIHTEAVASIVGRAELFAFAGSLGSIMLFVKEQKKLAAFLFFLALLSKETAIVTLPILWYILWAKENVNPWQSIKRLFVFIPSAVLYVLMRFVALGKYFISDAVVTYVENPLRFEDFGTRIFTSLKVLAMYMERIFYPLHLSADYSFNTIKLVGNFFTTPLVILGGLILVVFFVMIFYKKTKGKELGFAAVIFILPYLLISNLIFSVSTIMGERLMYFGSFGIVLIIAYVINKAMSLGNTYRKIFIGVTVMLVIFYGIITIDRNRDWASNQAIFDAAHAESEDGVITKSNVAALYMMEDRWDEAKIELEASYNIYPDYPYTIHLMAIIAHNEGDLARAEELYKKSIKLGTNPIDQYINLSNLYIQQDRKEESAEILLKIIEFYPTAERTASYAYIQISIGNSQAAIDVITKYFGESPVDAELNAALGTAYFTIGDYLATLRYLETSKSLGANAEQIETMIRVSKESI